MTLQYHDTYILLESTTLADVFNTPGSYTQVDFTGDINCCTQNCGSTVNTITILNPFTTTVDVQFTADGAKIFPHFFGLTDFTSGVYKFSVKTYKAAGGTVFEENCFFVDLDVKCKVAALLGNIIEENKTNGGEKVSTFAHLLHYALINGSNCGCNCEEMCTVFRELSNILSSVDPQIFIDCGC